VRGRATTSERPLRVRVRVRERDEDEDEDEEGEEGGYHGWQHVYAFI
jgi:hypothetical protein